MKEKRYYINSFVNYWLNTFDYIPTNNDIKQEFKWYMNDNENIKVDLRIKKFRDIIDKSFDNILNNYENR